MIEQNSILIAKLTLLPHLLFNNTLWNNNLSHYISYDTPFSIIICSSTSTINISPPNFTFFY